tara:strand:+ start:216 stop:524 length:309 start_codon:yes stop_codon:yes gene_type:complete
MILHNLVELVKQHHPHMTENEIRHLLNRAADDICMKAELVKTQFDAYNAVTDTSATTIANRRFYKLPESLFKINEVFLNGVKIPRTLTKPIINDYEEEEDNI